MINYTGLFALAVTEGVKEVNKLRAKGADEDYGPCGFATISLPKANTKFAKWATQHTTVFEKDDWRSGVHWWVGEYNQSLLFKEAFAMGVTRCLGEHGIAAYYTSRMD